MIVLDVMAHPGSVDRSLPLHGLLLALLERKHLMAQLPNTSIINAADVSGVPQVSWGRTIEVTAIRFALIFGLIQLVSVVLLKWSQAQTPLTGPLNSVAGHALISSVILCLIVTPIAFLRRIHYRDAKVSQALARKRNWAVIPVTVGVSLVVALVVIGGFEIFSRNFQDVMLDRASTSTILVLLVGVLAYLIPRTIMSVKTAATLVNLAATYLLATLFFATYFNENPLWWQRSFSYLGMTESNSRYIFNIGLIFTGILVIAWQYYFMESFAALESLGKISRRTYNTIRWILIVAGIALSMVGIVRFGISPLFNVIHDVSATGMGVLVALLMITLYRLVPGYDKIFYAISMVMALTIVAAAVLKVMGMFNLVGLELTGFVLAVLWLVLFYRNTELLLAETALAARDEAVTTSTA
jgi:hypothetical membrane protein